jgi:hypothetical protein
MTQSHPNPADRKYLRAIVSERYVDFSGDPMARPACERLARLGLCRVVQEDERCWRIYQSAGQQHRSLELLGATQPGRRIA